MADNTGVSPASRRAGVTLSALTVLLLLGNGLYSLLGNRFDPEGLRAMVEEGGFHMSQAPLLGWVMVICALVYALPRTRVIGAILITAFYGGAVAIETRIGGTPWLGINILLAAIAWGGLYLSDRRWRSLLPLTGPGGPGG